MTPSSTGTTAKRRPTTAAERAKRRDTLRPHPARDKIVDYLQKHEGPQSPTKIAPAIGISLGAAAYHFRTLVDAGIVELADEGRVRGAVEHFYALVDLDELSNASGDFDDLLKVAGALTVTVESGSPPVPPLLDDAAKEELLAVKAQLGPRVLKIVTASTRRNAIRTPA